MLQLTPLYHWSPAGRRRSIERRGLQPGMRPSRPMYDLDGETEIDWRADHIYLAPDPVTAARMSWRVFGEPGQEWDLWQAELVAVDNVRMREDSGPYVLEVRVYNRIPKSRLTWLGSRVLRDHRGRPA
jgi:hypothetical protein